MADFVQIGRKKIGNNFPVFLVAEIGINHNGSLEDAVLLIRKIADAGFDAVKFQKRTPSVCVPHDQRNVMRQTPWGKISYFDYRNRVEFSSEEYRIIDDVCRTNGLVWFASCWDIPSVDFMETFDAPCYKIASACLTDDELLEHIRKKNRPVILSTGMSTMDEIHHAVSLLDAESLILAHTTSAYPCSVDELNINMIKTLKNEFSCPVGYSGHEKGILMSSVAIGVGAVLIERHVTLDCTIWGSDQAASLAPNDFVQLVENIRMVESGLGDGIKTVYETEQAAIEKLRLCKKNETELNIKHPA